MPKDRVKRVAIYARVSTQNGRQDPETQLRELREFAERRGFKIVGEFIDHATGTTSDRTSYKRLFEAVRRAEKVDVVLVWRYDRFARSTRALINAISKQLGIAYGTAWNYAKASSWPESPHPSAVPGPRNQPLAQRERVSAPAPAPDRG